MKKAARFTASRFFLEHGGKQMDTVHRHKRHAHACRDECAFFVDKRNRLHTLNIKLTIPLFDEKYEKTLFRDWKDLRRRERKR